MRFRKLIALALVVLTLSGCRMFKKEPVGETIYLLDLALCGDQAWLLERGDEGRTLLRDGEVVLEGLVSAQFDWSGSACLYLSDGKLVRYDLADGSVREIAPTDKAPLIFTEGYALIRSKDQAGDQRIDLADGTVTGLKNLPQGGFSVLAVARDLVYIDSYQQTIAVYDAGADLCTELWQYGKEYRNISASAVLDGFLYFAQNGLWRLDLTTAGAEPEILTFKTPVAMAVWEDGLLCAVKIDGNQLAFYTGLEQREPQELARWTEAGYYVPDSCMLAISGSKAACAVSTGKEIISFDLP